MSEKDFWSFLNSFAPWLSALGTVSAVLVSLWLARRDYKVRLKIYVYINSFLNENKENLEYLAIEIFNIGRREVQISGIVWQIGCLRKRHLVQFIIKNSISSSLPIKLKDGEAASYYLPLDNWIKSEAVKLTHNITELNFIRLQVTTTVQDIFTTKIHKNLKERLKKELI